MNRKDANTENGSAPNTHIPLQFLFLKKNLLFVLYTQNKTCIIFGIFYIKYENYLSSREEEGEKENGYRTNFFLFSLSLAGYRNTIEKGKDWLCDKQRNLFLCRKFFKVNIRRKISYTVTWLLFLFLLLACLPLLLFLLFLCQRRWWLKEIGSRHTHTHTN